MSILYLRTAIAALVSLGAVLAAHAQPVAPVLKMDQVTEQVLVDALAIDEPAADEGPKTRSLRPTVRPIAPAARPSAGKSSLLITFNTNSAELTGESKKALDTVARALQSDRLAAFAFSIEGHADPRGGDDLNQRLSQARALAVVEYLVGTHGVAAERLAPVGKGSSELLNPERPDAPENRRVTIVTKRP